MNAGNGMVAFLSWLLAILRGPSGPSAPSWRGQHGFASVMIPLHSSPGAFLVFLSHQPCAPDPTHGHVHSEAVLAEGPHCPAASTRPGKRDCTSSAQPSKEQQTHPLPLFGDHPSLWLRRKINPEGFPLSRTVSLG